MGRKSREKRERRGRGKSPLERALRDLSPAALLPLLEAASVSPTASHRGPSLATLFHRMVQRPSAGRRPAAASGLPVLVEAVSADNGAIAALEGFQPYTSFRGSRVAVLDGIADVVDRDDLAGPGMHLGNTSADE